MAKKFNHEIYLLAASILSKSNAEEVYKCFEIMKSYNDQHVIGMYCSFLLLLVFFLIIILIKFIYYNRLDSILSPTLCFSIIK